VGPGVEQPIGGAGWPHMAASASLPRRGVLWSPLEPSLAGFAAGLHN
jgi:hypothetical protein